MPDDDVVVRGEGREVGLRHVDVGALQLDPLGPQSRVGGRQEEGRGAREGGDAHPPGRLASVAVEPCLHVGDRGLDADRSVGQESARIREAQPSAVGLDEQNPEVALRRAQLLGHR